MQRLLSSSKNMTTGNFVLRIEKIISQARGHSNNAWHSKRVHDSVTKGHMGVGGDKESVVCHFWMKFYPQKSLKRHKAIFLNEKCHITRRGKCINVNRLMKTFNMIPLAFFTVLTSVESQKNLSALVTFCYWTMLMTATSPHHVLTFVVFQIVATMLTNWNVDSTCRRRQNVNVVDSTRRRSSKICLTGCIFSAELECRPEEETSSNQLKIMKIV